MKTINRTPNFEVSDAKLLNKHSNKKSFWTILIALWIVFILLSQVPFIAEDLIDTSEMDDTVESHLMFTNDGRTGHYYVERVNTSEVGLINVIYTTQSNSLEVDCTNIKVLKIYCREMYEKKSEEVLKRDPELDSNYYKTYFIERDHFNVHVYTQSTISELAFIDTPIPYNVTVNGHEWWLSEVNYTYNDDGIVFTKVPAGHNYVDIYFKSNDKNSPVAIFSTDKTIIGINETVTFNASSSYDPDGQIISYVWDLSDSTYKGGVTSEHSYTKEGTYNVILTVMDDDHLIDRSEQEIIVVKRVMGVSISVDKPIATPGSVLSYTISPTIDPSWINGVKDIVVTDILPKELNYLDATPLPVQNDKTLSWNFGIAFEPSELTSINLQATINENVVNNSIISNSVTMKYSGISGQQFPIENSKIVITKMNVESIYVPTILEPVLDIILFEDAPPYDLELGTREFDPQDSGNDLNWHITEDNESLYHISGEYSNNDIITITPEPNAYGDSLVTLWLVDRSGYSTNQPLWINITPVNDEPIFSDAPDLIVHGGEPYTFDYEPYISDIDTAKDDLQLIENGIVNNENIDPVDGGSSSSTNQVDITIHGFFVTYKLPESFMGKRIFVSLKVTDGSGSDEDTILINVTDDFTPKLKKALPDVWISEGEIRSNVFDMDDYFEDPDMDSLFYSFGDTHVDIHINENHSVDISSPSEWNGVDTVTFRARDPIGAIAEDTIFVTVMPVNDPPKLSGVPDIFIVHYDSDYTFDLTPYINDEDNSFDELFLILEDEHIRADPLNQLKIIMNYPEVMVDLDVPVKIIVSDGIDTGSDDITVKVTNNWPPEVTNKLLDISFYEDDMVINAFNLNDYFLDKDSDTLFYSYGQEFVNIAINTDGGVDFSAKENWYGIEIVTFRATDPSDAFVECAIIVTVNPVNDPPIIHPIPDQIGMVKQLYRLDLTDFFEDIDNDISELTIEAESEKLDVSISGRELILYSSEATSDDVRITVSDGLAETSTVVLFEIQDNNNKKSATQENFLMSLLWLIILLIIVTIITLGYTYRRRYYGKYIIEEIFCIYNNGILIKHETSKSSKHSADEYVVSGMLTAILNFTQDAFNESDGDDDDTDGEGNKTAWGIKEIQMNEKNILVERGNYVFLATVFSGRSGKKLYNESRRVLNTIESKYQKKLQSWQGNVKQLSGTKNILRSMVLSTNGQDNNGNDTLTPERK